MTPSGKGHGRGNPKGVGRPKGARSAVQQQAIDVASQVLAGIDQVALWNKFLNSDDHKLAFDALKYLSDRAYGKAVQPTTISGSIGIADLLAKANELMEGE